MSERTAPNGREIIGYGVALRKTGDGLSTAMAVDPFDIEQGDEVYVLVKAKCIDVHHPPENRKYPAIGGVRQVVQLDADTGTFVAAEFASAAITAQAERNREYADRAAGQVTISSAILDAEHDDGLHTKRVVGCTECDREAELEAAEKAEAAEAAQAAAAERVAAREAEADGE